VKRDSRYAFELAPISVSRYVSKYSVTVQSYFVLMKELTKLDSGLRVYFIAFVGMSTCCT